MSREIGILELARRSGVPISTIQVWLKHDILRPVGSRIYRGRVVNTFSQKSVKEVRVFRALRGFASFQFLRNASKILRSYGHNPFSKGTFLIFRAGNGKVRIVKSLNGKNIDLKTGEAMLPLWELTKKKGYEWTELK